MWWETVGWDQPDRTGQQMHVFLAHAAGGEQQQS
jgi:hypothetical protein